MSFYICATLHQTTCSDGLIAKNARYVGAIDVVSMSWLVVSSDIVFGADP